MSKFEYLKLADTVAVEIASGALKPGDRLPPQRSFAYERQDRGLDREPRLHRAARRGLVVGEVGRGTFVSGETRRGISSLTEPRGHASTSKSIIRCCRRIGDDRAIARGTGAARSARCRAPADQHHRHAATRTISAEFLSRATGPRAPTIRLHRQRRQCIAAALAAVVPSAAAAASKR